ncbi:hypothetical protein TPAR_07042, partial [Tolypocladium paradoxum]
MACDEFVHDIPTAQYPALLLCSRHCSFVDRHPYGQCASTADCVDAGVPRASGVCLARAWACSSRIALKMSGYHLSPTSGWLLTLFRSVASPNVLATAPFLKVNSTSSTLPPIRSTTLRRCSLTSSGTAPTPTVSRSSKSASSLTPWKKGMEKRAPEPAAGDSTRCVV